MIWSIGEKIRNQILTVWRTETAEVIIDSKTATLKSFFYHYYKNILDTKPEQYKKTTLKSQT